MVTSKTSQHTTVIKTNTSYAPTPSTQNDAVSDNLEDEKDSSAPPAKKEKKEKHAKGSRSSHSKNKKAAKSSAVAAWMDRSEPSSKRKTSSDHEDPLSITIPSTEKSKPLIAPARFKPESTLISPVDTQPLPFVKPTTLKGRSAEGKSRTSSTSSSTTQESSVLPKPKRTDSITADPFENLKLATGIAPQQMNRRSSRERRNITDLLPKSPATTTTDSSREASPVKSESPTRRRQAATKAAENIHKQKTEALPIAEILKEAPSAGRAGKSAATLAVTKQAVSEKAERDEKKPRQPRGRKRKIKSADDDQVSDENL